MSKTELAELVGVSPNSIIRYESGEITPSDENLKRLADILSFPVGFFAGEDIDEPRRDNASFRGMASKSAKIMDAALASGTLAFILDDWVGSEFYRSEANLLDLQHEAPETAAMLMRQHWRLGDKPIKNMVHLLEANGVRVFSLAENTKAVDAFSLWRDDVPYVFLNRFKSAERSRFDAAHELAHLCIHKHGGAHAEYKESDIEKQANEFAGAFLMPESDVKSVCDKPIFSVDQLVRYKRRWRVSAAALNYRANQIGLIPTSRSNSNYVEMSRRGWLKNEPEGILREQSFIWQEIINDLNTRGITKTKIAEIIKVPATEIEALLFGLANMLAIDGQGSTTPRRDVNLRLVKNEH
ncbi:helix-turn-helix domain-containing protein [Phyllobacterium sp. K27]